MSRFIDISGQKFHNWQVLSFSHQTSKDSVWLCQCKCGLQRPRRGTVLRSGRSKSCIRCSQEMGYEELTWDHWSSILYHAKERKFEVAINIQEAYELFLAQDRKCALTGIPIVLGFTPGQSKQKYTKTASLDRIDSTKGYLKTNVEWVHKDINWMKRSLSRTQFVEWCKLVATHQEKA